jgi:hypothetical protein
MRMNDDDDSVERLLAGRRRVYVVTSMLAIVIVTVAVVYLYPRQSGPAKAAIVDQLGSSRLDPTSRHSNSTFIEGAKQLLNTRFSIVDYYSDNATVEEYKLLSAYKLILWRAHSALDNESKYIAISTSEKYGSTNYDQYLENGQLTLCNITGDPNLYFAITPSFVREIMSGRFDGAVIIFMSCNGLKEGYNKTAESFVEKGVKAFISWDGWVDKSKNDNAISLLLEYLISENNTIAEAGGKIPHSPSPLYGPCALRYCPAEAANYTIPNYKQGNATSNSTPWFVTISARSRSTKRHSPN